MIKKVWILICGSVVLAHFLFVPQLAAQDENAEPPPEQEGQRESTLSDLTEETSVPEESETKQDPPQTIDDLDSFVPSEEVSSDLSISYPVDI